MLARPARSDLTSVPVSWMPTSKGALEMVVAARLAVLRDSPAAGGGVATHSAGPTKGRPPRCCAQLRTPTWRIADSIRSRLAALGEVSGSRTSGSHLPSSDAAYLTGIGLLSTNSVS